ncbi:MAG: copper-binding protein [Phycisphaerales bacterium]
MPFPATQTVRRAPWAATAILLGALAFVASCDCKTGDSAPLSGSSTPQTPAKTVTPGADPAAGATPDAVYVVRGQIVELPDPAKPASEFRVHHEAIDTFADSTGKVVGMGAMTMPFPLKDKSLLEGLQVGDVVQMTFEDFYKPRRRYFVTKIEKLPADTALEFRDARPAK